MRRDRKWSVEVSLVLVAGVTALAAGLLASGPVVAGADAAFASPPGPDQKLTAFDAQAGDEFGSSVAILGDMALVGAPSDDDVADDAGAAYVYWRRSDGVWETVEKLHASDAASLDWFGRRVALSSETALVGAVRHDNDLNETGEVYVFWRTPVPWMELQRLRAPDGEPAAGFGEAIAVSGHTAVIGSLGGRGAAYVFEQRIGDVKWDYKAKLSADDGDWGDRFGRSVAVCGGTVLVGAPGDDDRGGQSGSVYVFTRSGGTWTLQRKLQAADGQLGDAFGESVALWGDTALIGASGDDDRAIDAGAAYVFTRTGDIVWDQTRKLTASDGDAWEYFGSSVTLADGVALIGAPDDDEIGYGSGSAYLFDWSADTWTQRAKLTAPYWSAEEHLGRVIALSKEAAVAGGSFDDVKGEDAGAAFSWSLVTSSGPVSDVIPAELGFERTAVGCTARYELVTLRNVGTSDLHVLTNSIVGAAAAEFAIEPSVFSDPPTLTPTIAPGSGVEFVVRFTPQAAGRRGAALKITTDDPETPKVIRSLVGDGAECIATPIAATIGTEVVVWGNGFGSKKGRILLLGGRKPVPLKILQWNFTDGAYGNVTGVVVRAMAAGAYQVSVAPRGAEPLVDTSAFTIVAPAIVGLAPSTGAGGSQVVLTCSALGTAKGSVYLQASGAKKHLACKILVWTPAGGNGTGWGSVQVLLPKKLAAGTVYDVVVKNRIGEAKAVAAFTATP